MSLLYLGFLHSDPAHFSSLEGESLETPLPSKDVLWKPWLLCSGREFPSPHWSECCVGIRPWTVQMQGQDCISFVILINMFFWLQQLTVFPLISHFMPIDFWVMVAEDIWLLQGCWSLRLVRLPEIEGSGMYILFYF